MASKLKSTLKLLLLLTLAGAKGVDGENDFYQDEMSGVAWKDTRIEERIVGGSKAEIGQFPWQAMLLDMDEPICGGTLISSQWILTAANCVAMPKNLTRLSVRLGSLNQDDHEKGRVELDIPKENVIVHEEYNACDGNDIALIKLPIALKLPKKKSAPFTINKIKLPKSSDKKKGFIGSPSIASGWGSTDGADPNNRSPDLMFLSQKVVSNTDCVNFYGGNFQNIICADSDQTSGSCNGDAGGPLVIQGKDKKYTLYGVNSFGSSSCVAGPDAFTKVASYTDWIKKKTKK